MAINLLTVKSSKTILTTILLLLVLTSLFILKPSSNNNSQVPINTDNAFINYIKSDFDLITISTLYTSVEKKISDIEITQTRNQRMQSLISYLSKVHSPIANEHYAGLIIDLSEANGVDYRVVVALMGTESGWCKKPIYYNCFGYLNRVKYKSFDEAFNYLIQKISKQYLVRYGWNFAGFIASYGRLSDEYAYSYGRNMYSIASKLFY